MAVYMADQNGDWWGTNGKTNTLYVFDTDKLTLAQKIQIIDEWGYGFDLETNKAEEVDEMLGDVAAEAMKNALKGGQKKLDKNHNGKIDAQDLAMLRAGKGKQETDEGWDDMLKDVEKRRASKVGDVEHGSKHDIEHTATGRKVTRRVDDKGISVGADDDKPADGEKRGRGRPAGSKSGANQKVTSGKSYGGVQHHSLNLPNTNR